MFSRLLVIIASICAFTTLNADETYLYQRDFDRGSYIIKKPGTYRLGENISFNPNSPKVLQADAYDSGMPQAGQFFSKRGKYDDQNFGLGFFAAIVIATPGVTLDLNGYTLEQSREHALLQRFFSVIELANQPFISGQGPHNFGNHLRAAKGTVIKNGVIGRSSHHGIHGNGNRDITIENIDFKDFEIAALALNGVSGLLISNCTAESRQDVPVLGTFSAARFIQPYLDYLVDIDSKTTLNIGGQQPLAATQVRDRLRQAINVVHEDLIANKRATIDPDRHPEEYALFHNAAGVVDGNCYGFLVNALGQAVEGFPVHSRFPFRELAKNIKFNNVHVKRLEGKVNEIIALRNDKAAVVDPVGSVFQVKNIDPNTGKPLTVSSLKDNEAFYTGNLLANAQALVAKAHLKGEFKGSHHDVSRLNITQKIIDWIESDPKHDSSKLSYLVPEQSDYICNGDSMFHVNKGVIAFKIDAANNVVLNKTSARNITNFSEVGSGMCGAYKISHPKATLTGCGGSKVRGYSFAGSSNVRVLDSEAGDLFARCGTVIGFDILTDSSHITINRSLVTNAHAGKDFKQNEAPNDVPAAIGFHIGPSVKDVALIGVCGKDLEGVNGDYPVLDQSHRAKIHINCRLTN